VKEMSAILEYVMNQVVHDMDVVFSREYGALPAGAGSPDSSGQRETEKFRSEGGE